MTQILAKFDLAVVGGGIVGLATARQVLSRHPKLKLCVLEKEPQLASHQTARNSGVVHAGIYYKKNSLKSRFCVRGSKLVEEYCEKKKLPFKKCGKLILATNSEQLTTLHNLFENAKGNKLEAVELINKDRIDKIQPGCTMAVEAIWSPDTAIVDWRQIALAYADDVKALGGQIMNDYPVMGFSGNSDGMITLERLKSHQLVQARSIVNCAGLYSEFLAMRTSNRESPKVLPVKGRYLMLSDELASKIRTNIYPVPDPRFPFLGVHLTPKLDGSVLVGPTALVSLNYEYYDTSLLPNFYQIYHIFLNRGFFNMVSKKENLLAGFREFRKFVNKGLIANEVSQLYPQIQEKDLIEVNFCGTRAQAIDKEGNFVDDFMFETALNPEFKKILHVRNAPSPAATSSLAIAERLVEILEERFI